MFYYFPGNINTRDSCARGSTDVLTHSVFGGIKTGEGNRRKPEADLFTNRNNRNYSTHNNHVRIIRSQ